MVRDKRKNYVKAIRYTQMGLSIGINFVLWSFVGFFAGSKLDEKLGTDPWLMLVGILLGIGFAFYATIKEILVLEETDEEE